MQKIRLVFLTIFLFLISSHLTAKASSTFTAGNPVVVIRTSYATSKFDEGWGGVFTAAPVKNDTGYELYDVVIWNDRISLYKFDNDLDKKWNDRYEELRLAGLVPTNESEFNDWYEKQYRAFREEYLLKEVLCTNDESNIYLNSNIRLDAYKEFFNIIKNKTPSTNIVIKYSGHGYGVLFSGALSEQDSLSLLKYGVNLFGTKFAIIDYGTNCGSGNTVILDFYADYTEFMNVSQLNVGGYSYDNWTYEQFMATDSDARYHTMFTLGSTAREASIKIAGHPVNEWACAVNNLKQGQIPQSAASIDMTAYKLFRDAMKKAKKKEVLTDLYTLIKDDKNLLDLYKKMILCYVDNREILGGEWTYGEGITCLPSTDDNDKKDEDADQQTKEFVIRNDSGKKPTADYIGPANKKVTKISIPATVTVDGKEYPVTSISANAFKNCKKLKSVSIPESVKEIKKNTFKNLANLKNVYINGDKLKTVGKNAFKGTNKKLKITIKTASKKKYNSVVKRIKASGSYAKKIKYQHQYAKTDSIR